MGRESAGGAEESLDRYEDLGLLGCGGMGEVRRVRDRALGRVVARKQVRADVSTPDAVHRFIDEVRTTARLQHPGVVPVYDFGQTADGAPYFTMKEVQGQDLASVIAAVHAVSGDTWETTRDGWNLRRVVSALHQASLAVAYAHERGVVHRDLKPANIMLGVHGEVQVMDWGLAATLADLGGSSPIAARRIAGTPAYMAPEQARGDLAAIDGRTDVYALGAVLYEVLTGRPPHAGTAAEVVARLNAGGTPTLAQTIDWDSPDAAAATAGPPGSPVGRLPLPGELVEAADRAMAHDPDQRFPSAAAFAHALQSWLDGSRQRERAMAVVERAEVRRRAGERWRAEAAALRAEGAALLDGVPPWSPEHEKAAGWAKEDAAEAAERQAQLADLDEEVLLRAALTHAGDLPDAHAALARRYRAEHAAAEAMRQSSLRAEGLLRRHAEALPASHPERAGHLAWLQGDGALTLVTDPPGAEVELFRTVARNRRLIQEFERPLGRTPLVAIPLPMGSWSCRVHHPDRAEVWYPVWIGRGEHWDGVPPTGGEPTPVVLPRRDALGALDCYVPAGWFQAGGDRGSMGLGPPSRRVWVDGVAVRRFPVTNREFLVFLDDLTAQGRQDEALRHAPRERSGVAGDGGGLIYAFDGRRFSLHPDADGDVWHAEYPVVMVDWHAAAAYAAWEAARTGHPWRLLTEPEWEKSARGVDGRLFPWGDRYDPSWACSRSSHAGRPLPQVVDSFPLDESVYGVRGMAGNVRDWCADAFAVEGSSNASERRVLRGGSWDNTAAGARLDFRFGGAPTERSYGLGFRLARSVPG